MSVTWIGDTSNETEQGRSDKMMFHDVDRRRELHGLCPGTLRPGDIVTMDNLGSHRGKTVRQLIRSVGAKLLFLPKYSPDQQDRTLKSRKRPPDTLRESRDISHIHRPRAAPA